MRPVKKWHANRLLSKLNYVVHTDAIKKYIVPTLTEQQIKFVYANEADVLNVALFVMTAKELDSIYNGGCTDNPDICFAFMNSTGRNIASSKNWKGLKSPWIGTKNIWDLFEQLDLVDEKIYTKIKSIKGTEWTEKFAEEVYDDVKKHKYFITNLGKCNQVDARELPDSVYKEYLNLLNQEFNMVKPKIIILFGNQVSSIVLNEKISVSQVRKKCFIKKINGEEYKFYSVYYPIGNGRFNIDKSIEDIKWIIKHELL